MHALIYMHHLSLNLLMLNIDLMLMLHKPKLTWIMYPTYQNINTLK